MMKSGQTLVSFDFSSSLNRFHRLFRSHAASGDRLAPLGRVNIVEESKQRPVRSSSAHATKRKLILEFLCPVFGLVGDMMISSPSALISNRKSLLSRQKRRN